MSSLLPLRPSTDHTPRSHRSLPLRDEVTGDVISALQSATAREIVDALADDPATATDLAGLTGTSPQNVHHHLEQLADAGLVAEVDIWYSERGVEMAVYDLVADALCIDLASGADPPQSPSTRIRGDRP